MDAFHDLLQGGFGVHEMGEEIDFFGYIQIRAGKTSDMKQLYYIGKKFSSDAIL